MKRFSPLCIVIAILFSSTLLRAADGDTTILPLLTKVSFPGTPTSLDAKVMVPKKSWARLVLKLKLECPCAPLQGEWDYTNTYYIKVPNGKKDSLGNALYDNLEIARFITPYWKYQPAGSNYTWWWDVTDYAYLMKDSTSFSVHYDGYSSSETFSVWIEAIEGTPPYNVFAIDNLWQSYYTYGNTKNPIDKYLLNKKFRGRDTATYTKLKMTTTGHGGYGPQVVAEFIDKTHHIALNGTDRFTQHLWRTDCGSNPYYPQDGTWALQRAGWCPGDIVPTWDWDISPYVTKGDSTRLDYKMEKFEVDSNCNGGYAVSTQVMYAKGPNFTNDASLEEILAPNIATAKTRYSRMNPICGNPVVRIRNNGKAPITSLSFEYGVHGETPMTFTWSGNVPMMSTADVTLPAPDWKASFAATSRQFDCRIVKTNGVADEYPLFNSLSSTYSTPPSYDGNFEVNYRTNKQVQNQGIYWQITNSSDSVVAGRQTTDLEDETTYTDSLHLAPGCYKFQWVNPSSYGIAWWAVSGSLGSGSLSFTSHNATLQTFGGDCGNGITQQFIVSEVPQIKVVDNVQQIYLGAVAVGDSIRKSITVTPLNSAGLSVSKVAVQALAKGFSLVSTDPVLPASGAPLVLKQGQMLNITVQYKPQVAGKKAATLAVTSNDLFNPSLSIPMIGYDFSVGVNDEAAVPHLEVFPSIANSELHVRMSVDGTQSSNVHCGLYDNLGREVRSLNNSGLKAMSSAESTIDVSNLAPGAYFVVLRAGTQSCTVPVVVSH